MRSLFILLFTILIVILFYRSAFGYTYSSNANNKTESFVHLGTNKPKYIMGEVVTISGYLDDSNGYRANGIVTIQISDQNRPVSTESIYTTKNGSFKLNFNDTDKPGDYRISVASINHTKPTDPDTISIHIYDFFNTRFFTVLLYSAAPALIGLFILLLLVSKYKKGQDKQDKEGQDKKRENFEIPEIFRFILISGIALSPILAFILSDMQMGTNTPIGLIVWEPLDQNGKPRLDTNGHNISQWIIHIGGTPANNYATGLNVPFYVIAFGLLGGYLRYLHKAARKENDEFSKMYDQKGYTSGTFMHETLGELSHILLSPLLAMGLWFIISQEDTYTNAYIYASVSFAVGLITEEVIHFIVSLAKGRLKDTDKR